MMFSSLPIDTLCHCGDSGTHGYNSDHSPVFYDVRHNPPNPILVEFREENEKNEIDLNAYIMWLEVEIFAGFFPHEQVEHAFLVLNRVRSMRK